MIQDTLTIISAQDTVASHFLNGQTKASFIAIMLWGLIGFVFSVILDLIRHRDKIKKKGGFSLAYWITDNWLRAVASIMAIFIGSIFSEDLFDTPVSNKGALIAGLVTDKTIEAFMFLKDKINVSALWKPKQ